MAGYILKRVLMAAITILVVACVTFLLMQAVPGSPFNEERALTESQVAALNEKYGLDKPVAVQLVNYLKNAVFRLDLGESLKMRKGTPVTQIIREMFPISAKIGVISLTWAVAVGVPLGCLAAYYRGRWVDSLLRVVCTLGISMPGFVVASLLLLLLAGGGPLSFLGLKAIFDASQGAKAYVMPCAALGLYPMCYIARLTRSSMLDAIGQEYIKTARAKGLKPGKIVFKHALRNALIPVITYLGPLVAFTLCGGFVVETVFSIPGLGRYFVQSIQNRDYFIIMGTTIFLAAFVVVMNLVVDILYRLVDPRIDLAKGGA